MTFEELSTVRYTQRSYDTKPVKDDKIQKILQAGRVPPHRQKQPTAKGLCCSIGGGYG